MRVAVAVENGMVFAHFGQTKCFQVYQLEGDTITRSYPLPTFGEGHEAMVSCLTEIGANVLICGGIGAEAKVALGEAGILTFGGIIGRADDAVRLMLEGKLQSASAGACDGHACEGHCAACEAGHCGQLNRSEKE